MSTFASSASAWSTRPRSRTAPTTGPVGGVCYQVTFTEPGEVPASVVHVADHVLGAQEREGLRLELIAQFELDERTTLDDVTALGVDRVRWSQLQAVDVDEESAPAAGGWRGLALVALRHFGVTR